MSFSHKYYNSGLLSFIFQDQISCLSNTFYSLFPQSQKDPTTIDRIMKDLDANGDGEVNFEEFVSLVVGLSIACEACYRMQLKKTQSWK